jgi:hypothetical protein
MILARSDKQRELNVKIVEVIHGFNPSISSTIKTNFSSAKIQ